MIMMMMMIIIIIIIRNNGKQPYWHCTHTSKSTNAKVQYIQH